MTSKPSRTIYKIITFHLFGANRHISSFEIEMLYLNIKFDKSYIFRILRKSIHPIEIENLNFTCLVHFVSNWRKKLNVQFFYIINTEYTSTKLTIIVFVETIRPKE